MWWLVFYRPLSGPAVAVDYVSSRGKAESAPPERGEGIIRAIKVGPYSFEEMELLKHGAELALERDSRVYKAGEHA